VQKNGTVFRLSVEICNMKNLYFLIPALLLLSACSGAKNQMERSDYDRVVLKVTDRLLKNKKVKDEELQILADAYQMALDRDKIRIQQLKSSGNPESWADVFEIYTNMQRRQDLAVRVNPLRFRNGQTLTLPINNITAAREEARANAAEFYYQAGLDLLNSELRSDARAAYGHFQQVNQYFKSYKDVISLSQQALDRGTAHILLLVDQNPNLFLPQNFAGELLSVDYNDAVNGWIFFHTDPGARKTYDYAVKLVMTESFISPSSVKELFCDEEKEIENGWQYVYDSRGNVAKDSAGNDIKVPKYMLVNARVTETQLFKSAAIRGVVEIYDYKRERMLRSVPAQGESIFNHYYALFVGDKRALSDESLKKIGNKPLPFPTDLDMVLLATNELKRMFATILRDQQRIFNTDTI
jgi:hypothetical protein